MVIRLQKSYRWVSLLLVVLLLASVLVAPVAFAASWQASATTACIRGWSVLSWAGYNPWDWGRTHAWLWWWNGSSWSLNGDKDSGTVFGAQGNLTPMATPVQGGLRNKYWQATGSSTASFFSGQVNRYGSSLLCP